MPLDSYGSVLPAPTTPMATALARAERYATLPADILLVGPTGSGKGHLAEYIHRISGRTGEFIPVTGGELNETLWASQLFGHVVGAFTDAKTRTRGAFERAAGGTLFLDELHHWSGPVQSGLLQPLERRRYNPLGSDREIMATCRIVFGTTMDPDHLVKAERLLPDLRHRLPALVISLPPLTARKQDILPFVDQFMAGIVTTFGWTSTRFQWAPDAVRALLCYDWPGNIRQLDRTLTRTVAQIGPAPAGAITATDLQLPAAASARLTDMLDPLALHSAVEWALRQTNGSHQDAATLLGIHRNTFATYLTRSISVA